MKHYFYWWKLGWISLVVGGLTVLVANQLAQGVFYLVASLQATDSMPVKVAVVAVTVLLIALPVIGGLFRVGMGVAARWIRPA